MYIPYRHDNKSHIWFIVESCIGQCSNYGSCIASIVLFYNSPSNLSSIILIVVDIRHDIYK